MICETVSNQTHLDAISVTSCLFLSMMLDSLHANTAYVSFYILDLPNAPFPLSLSL